MAQQSMKLDVFTADSRRNDVLWMIYGRMDMPLLLIQGKMNSYRCVKKKAIPADIHVTFVETNL